MSEKSRTFALVMELERHIEILLLSNDCVIVPGLGGFVAHHVDARYDEQDGMFVPPIRTLGFNPQLKMNDSLLVQSYIEAYDISYPEAFRRIEDEVSELASHLETEGYYELNDIGVLRLNEEGKMEFQPCEAGILTPEYYGLSVFEMDLLSKKTAAVVDMPSTEGTPAEDTITIKMSWLRNAVAVAAILIAVLMIGRNMSVDAVSDDTQQSSFINMHSTHRPAAARADVMPQPSEADEQPEVVEDLPASVLDEVTDFHPFCIVMASHVTEANAQEFVLQLEAMGFNEARVVVSGNKRIRRVVYGSYESEADAASTLKQLRHECFIFKNTWIMELK
jgi:hypothetical protein